jgi:hypothetical protein
MVLHMKRKRVLNGRPRMLTNAQVKEARRRWKTRTEKGSSIAADLGVSIGTFSRAVNGLPPYDKIK